MPGVLASGMIFLARSACKRTPGLSQHGGIWAAQTARYMPGMWRELGVAVAGLAGALTRPVFVAVSINSDVLARSCSTGSACSPAPN
jgi:hypothetical protein